jgi:N-terminal half of MaoC dehydratase
VTSAARTPLTEIPKGHQFPEVTFFLDPQDLKEYLAAVEDPNTCYQSEDLRYVPPLQLAAFALRELLGVVELPGGSLHTNQEIEIHEPVRVFDRLILSSRIAHRSERAGFVISILEFKIAIAGSPGVALTGRTTVMAPAAA